MIILDEGAHANPDMVRQAVLPLCEPTEVPLLTFSSPVGREDPFARMLRAVDPATGEPVMQLSQTELVCAACRAAGNELQCHHRERVLLPHFRSGEKTRRVRALMGIDDQALAHESLGIATEGARPFFSEEFQRRVAALPWRALEDYTSIGSIVVCVDPNSSCADLTRCSEMAIAAVAYVSGAVGLLVSKAPTLQFRGRIGPADARHVLVGDARHEVHHVGLAVSDGGEKVRRALAQEQRLDAAPPRGVAVLVAHARAHARVVRQCVHEQILLHDHRRAARRECQHALAERGVAWSHVIRRDGGDPRGQVDVMRRGTQQRVHHIHAGAY